MYRGSNLPGLGGQYIFGSFSQDRNVPKGEIFIAQPSASGMWPFQEIDLRNRAGGHLGEFLKGFGQDLSGEVYLLTSTDVGPTGSSGKVYKLALIE